MKKLIFVLLLIFIMPTYAFADQYKTTLSFTKDTVIIDGEIVQFVDSNNNNIYPLMFNGYIYLPIRSVADYFGKNIKWSQEERAIHLYGNKSKAKSSQFIPLKEKTNVDVTIDDNVKIYIDNVLITPETMPYLSYDMTDVIFLDNTLYVNMYALLGELISNQFKFAKEDVLSFKSNDEISTYDYKVYKGLYNLKWNILDGKIKDTQQIYNDFLQIKNIPIPKNHLNYNILKNDFYVLDTFLKDLDSLNFSKVEYIVYILERIKIMCSSNDKLDIQKDVYILDAETILSSIKYTNYESLENIRNIEESINTLKNSIPELLKDDKDEITSYLDAILLEFDKIEKLSEKINLFNNDKLSLTGKEYLEIRNNLSNLKENATHFMEDYFLIKVRGN